MSANPVVPWQTQIPGYILTAILLGLIIVAFAMLLAHRHRPLGIRIALGILILALPYAGAVVTILVCRYWSNSLPSKLSSSHESSRH
ncbi:hypothetical protein [Glutamicibacter endophyticus]|uniref:hypothetical protein n=1 Tax=Glutamicibacter endophyticus TaxID=1522174 RepID=UPI003AEF802D